MSSNHRLLLLCLSKNFFYLGLGGQGVTRILSSANSEAVPSRARAGVLGSSIKNECALRKASSAIVGEAIGPPRPSGPRGPDTAAVLAGPLRNQSRLSPRCQSEARLSAPCRQLSACGRRPGACSSFRFTVSQTSSLLFFHQRLECFHFLCLC